MFDLNKIRICNYFQECYHSQTIFGESKVVNTEMTPPQKETTLPTLLSSYESDDIFNADDFGFFYQYLPSKAFHLPAEKCFGGKRK